MCGLSPWYELRASRHSHALNLLIDTTEKERSSPRLVAWLGTVKSQPGRYSFSRPRSFSCALVFPRCQLISTTSSAKTVGTSVLCSSLYWSMSFRSSPGVGCHHRWLPVLFPPLPARRCLHLSLHPKASGWWLWDENWTSTSCVRQHSEVFPTSAGHSCCFPIAHWSVSLSSGERRRLRALLPVLPTSGWGHEMQILTIS